MFSAKSLKHFFSKCIFTSKVQLGYKYLLLYATNGLIIVLIYNKTDWHIASQNPETQNAGKQYISCISVGTNVGQSSKL